MLHHTVHRAARSAFGRVPAIPTVLRPAVVQAHCDTEDGPAVTAGRRALETGNLNHALPWIPADGGAELGDVFARALRVRALGPDAAEVADRLFLETLVRIHRMGEGVGFTGLKAAGGPLEPVVAAADAALASGDDDAVLALVPDDRRDRAHELFLVALGRRDHDVDDVAAARAYVDAYVAFVKYAEGEHHEHGHEHEHEHEHGHEHPLRPALEDAQ